MKEIKGSARTDVHLRYCIPKKLTVQVDTREKRPLIFPSFIEIDHPERKNYVLRIEIILEHCKLDAGDYRLKEYPACCIVERKGSVRELIQNLDDSLADSIRQAKALRRLTSSCAYPLLLLEFAPSEFEVLGNSNLLMHKLALVVAKYRLGLLWLPYKHWGATNRRRVGEFLIHLMLGFAIQSKLEILPNLVDTA